MSNNSRLEHCIKPIKRNDRNFIYKGKTYPINFELIKSNSNYFYNNSENYKEDNIELQEKIDISENTIKSFIECCHNKPFTIDDTNVFHLDYLSKKYEVLELAKITHEYLCNPKANLALESLLFKCQLRQNNKLTTDDEIQIIDTSNEEEIIGNRLNQYLNDDRLLQLSLPIIDRILKRHFIGENKGQNEPNQIINFLFKCLDVYKRDASILFLNINLENQPKDLIIRLINDYNDIFDFNMINLKSILDTSSELIKQLIEMKNEFNQKISEMNQIIIEQKNEINNFNEAKDLINNDFKIFIQKQNQIIEEQKNEIKKINEDKNQINNEFQSYMQKQNQIIEEQNNKINKLIEEQKNEFNKINEEHKNEINKINEEQKNEFNKINEDQKNEFNKINEEQKNEFNKIINEQKKEFNKIIGDQKNEILKIIEGQKNEINKINDDKNAIKREFNNYRQQQNATNDEHKRNINDLSSRQNKLITKQI